MRAVVIAGDVVGDLRSGLVDGFPFGSPGAASFELAEPGLDEGLGFGVAVAAASMSDASCGEVPAESSAGELSAVVGPERQPARLDPAFKHGLFDARDGFFGPAA